MGGVKVARVGCTHAHTAALATADQRTTLTSSRPSRGVGTTSLDLHLDSGLVAAPDPHRMRREKEKEEEKKDL